MEDSHKRIIGLVLRILALGATLTAAIIMATSRERASFYRVSFEAEYSDTPAFKYVASPFLIPSVIKLFALQWIVVYVIVTREFFVAGTL